MNILSILYWVILVVSAVFSFWPSAPFYLRGIPALALFVIIGLKTFKVPLQ